MLCMRHSSAGSMNHTFDRLIVNFYQNRAVCCRVSPFTISGPEGLRSLDLTLRKRSHYPCYATSPKFRNSLKYDSTHTRMNKIANHCHIHPFTIPIMMFRMAYEIKTSCYRPIIQLCKTSRIIKNFHLEIIITKRYISAMCWSMKTKLMPQQHLKCWQTKSQVSTCVLETFGVIIDILDLMLN